MSSGAATGGKDEAEAKAFAGRGEKEQKVAFRSAKAAFFPLLSRSERRLFLAGLMFIILLGAGLRLYQVGESLWLDELHTSWVVADGFSPIVARAWEGNQSPLYFVIAWASVSLLGHHDWAVRLPSLIAGIAMVGLVAGVMRRWSGSMSVGLFTALLVACNRDCIFYAQEARPYALVQLSALLHGWLFAELLVRPTAVRRVTFVIGGVWLFYLHYTTFLFLLAEFACWTLWLFSRYNRQLAYRPGQCLIDACSIAVLALPALPHLMDIAGRRDAWARLVQVWPSPALWNGLLVYGGIPVIGLLVGWGARLPRRLPRPANHHFWWALCWFGIPMVLACLSTASGLAALWMLRYLVASLVGMLLFAGLCLAVFADNRYRVIAGSAVLGAAILTSGMLPQWYRDGRLLSDRNEDWRTAVSWLNSQWPATRLPVLLFPGLLEDLALTDNSDDALRQYCCFPLRGVYRFDGDRIEPFATTTRQRPGDAGVALARQHRGAWLVIRARPTGAERLISLITVTLRNTSTVVQVAQRRAFGNLVVVRLQLRAPPLARADAPSLSHRAHSIARHGRDSRPAWRIGEWRRHSHPSRDGRHCHRIARVLERSHLQSPRLPLRGSFETLGP